MTNFKNPTDIDFTVDENHLYREESITDLKVASIRRLVPVKPDGTEDAGRTPLFLASTQLMTPEGPLPLQARLKATTLADAYKEFPGAMRHALDDMVAQLQQMRQEQSQQQQKEASRIIVPGR
ncbi:MAG: cytoplasmic protein [Desulfatitalea sp.]|nr:cytoplasmic protein [Desulfatitalea sp.]